ncbi:PD-(D/E)XK nuclease-like domain-containing protein [Brevundimonas sp. LjRoot202]|uniref:PD-(D/E)XK nuclease-like domain-containing protein n=1 Tax=Brevundimonas sp. LjRoot202 TaxID=3342281 RepID=UPI003ECDEDFC
MSLATPNVLPEGAKITAPGVWDLTMSVYHSSCCEGPSISSSGLRTIWSQSAAHYWYSSPYNPNPPEPEERPHFSIGRAAHHLLYLGRKGFDDEFVVRPSEWKDWRTAAAREWREEQIKTGRTIITDGELEKITGMARSLGAHPLVKQGILDGAVERSLIWQDPSGAWLKSRPDNIPTGSGLFADLKTTESVSDESLERSLASFGYHMQAALVGMASEAVLGRQMEEFAFVWVEKAPPHCVRVTVLTGEDLERGRMQLRRSIDTFARCVASGEWPGPGGGRTDAEYLQLPAWAAKRIDQALEVAAAEANDNADQPKAA